MQALKIFSLTIYDTSENHDGQKKTRNSQKDYSMITV